MDGCSLRARVPDRTLLTTPAQVGCRPHAEGPFVSERVHLERRKIVLHGHRVSYRAGGTGPLLLFVHGIAGTGDVWREVLPELAENHSVLALDLLGHGESAKPRGDYSLGAFASGVRDLLVALGHRRATVIGHSLGGGVAMQFSYQFPERCERLALVSSGGLGREVHLALRAAALPGSDWVLPFISRPGLKGAGERVNWALGKLGLHVSSDVSEFARGYASLADAETRRAFLNTVRTIIDPSGQRVNASDRLYLSAEMPTLIVWGQRDRIIPVSHAHEAHEQMPGSRLALFPDAGHFPQLDDPRRFVRTVEAFVRETEPAHLAPDALGDRLRAGA